MPEPPPPPPPRWGTVPAAIASWPRWRCPHFTTRWPAASRCFQWCLRSEVSSAGRSGICSRDWMVAGCHSSRARYRRIPHSIRVASDTRLPIIDWSRGALLRRRTLGERSRLTVRAIPPAPSGKGPCRDSGKTLRGVCPPAGPHLITASTGGASVTNSTSTKGCRLGLHTRTRVQCLRRGPDGRAAVGAAALEGGEIPILIDIVHAVGGYGLPRREACIVRAVAHLVPDVDGEHAGVEVVAVCTYPPGWCYRRCSGGR